MIALLKDAECYCPQYSGKKDILIAEDKIESIDPVGRWGNCPFLDRIIDCGGLKAFPGLIDQHVHIVGGGGEQGFASRIGDIAADDVFLSGVTTLVGLLGFDSCTKDPANLFAKAKSLQKAGLTAYIYSGGYTFPMASLTQNILHDLIMVNEVIGVGEVAIADHRSSQPSVSELAELASAVHAGGMIAGKAGVVHIHLGEGKRGLGLLRDILDQTDLPMEMFVPTHVNRQRELFTQAMEYCKAGGNIDLTAGETHGIPVPDAIEILVKSGMDLSRVTVSSDSNGSVPTGGVGKIQELFDDIRGCILEKGVLPETAFRFVTENVAKILKLYPRKGTLRAGADADIAVLDCGYNLRKLFCRGRQTVEDGRAVRPEE
ncbi:beta-aspartyl-peptidase [Caproiciproducens sp. NJN-50]|uniref:beta-aspartyl-peptidase n=1 Tax=Acutalibacteraceae TaxID=3082771 RepID=UPI000FFE2D4A|nr:MULTISPECIES: beta-aspartyl-peptidase [Acutalibacteraceae]QAT49429.1 beta-aspartyl-peptidase [Caproiciproducens sp. NJN-50]